MVYSDFGGSYVARGLELAFQKGVRRYVIIPLSINILLFTAAIYATLHYTGFLVQEILALLPSWLQWLEILIWPLVILAVVLVFAMTFTSVANVIASPFNSLLAEKVEYKLTGIKPIDGGVRGMIKDIPRIVGREFQKIIYFLPRAIIFGLLFLLLPIVGQVLWFLFSGWMMTIQYADYPFDNHKVPFKHMRRELSARRGKSLSFGCIVAFLATIPLVNLMLIPIAVCGATAMWVDHIKFNRLAN